MPSYRQKIIIAGYHIRTITSDEEIPFGFKSKKTDYSKALEGSKDKYSQRRTQDLLVLTVDANVNHWSKFLTLTFAEPITERKQAMIYFKQFLKNITRHFGNPLRYIGVTERQLKRGANEGNSGAWHFHLVVFNNEKLPFEELKTCWPYGSVDIKKVDDVKNLGKYLGKYLGKQFGGVALNEKAVFKSRGLKEPLARLDYDLPAHLKETYSAKYQYVNEKTGQVISFTQKDYTTR